MAPKQAEVIVDRYIKLLRSKNIRIDKAILFGSYAAGKADEDSDIDLAVIGPDFGRDRIEETIRLKELAEEIDYDLSPRPYSTEQYRKASRGDFLHDEVIEKGKTIAPT